MSNEINLNIIATLRNGLLADDFKPGNVQIDQATAEMDSGQVIVGTSEEDMTFVDVSSPGILLLRNLDAANFVEYGPKNGSNVRQDFLQLHAGDIAVMRLDPAITLRWSADTAPVKVFFKLWSN